MSRRAARMRALEKPSTFSPRNEHLAGRRLDQPQHAAAGRALAAARFADQRERLALIDGEAHVVHGPHDRLLAEQPAAALEVLDEIADLDERPSASTCVRDRRGRLRARDSKCSARWSAPSSCRSAPRRRCHASGSAARTSSRAAAREVRDRAFDGLQPSAGVPPGIDASRPRVYGCFGSGRSRAPGPARRCGRRTSPRRDRRSRRSRRGRA